MAQQVDLGKKKEMVSMADIGPLKYHLRGRVTFTILSCPLSDLDDSLLSVL